MALRRSRRIRGLALSTLLLASIGAAVWWRSRSVRDYTPGEPTEGLVDRLARKLPDDVPAIHFEEVGEAAGLDFHLFPGVRTGRLPEDMGSGVAIGDANGDGWPDVFFVNNAPPGQAGARCALFENRGDGTFADATDTAGVGLELHGMAAAFADVDSDGDLDLFVTAHGTCRLLLNDGAGRFSDGTAAAGLDELEGFWTGIGVGDYDRDGALDLYVCGYVHYEEQSAGSKSQFGVEIPVGINPSAFEPHRNLLLRGHGDGTFEEVARAAGVDDPRGKGLGVLFTDLDGDGWPDLYVANDVSDNALFLNRGDGTFEDRTAESMVGDYRGAMGLAAADFDADLDLDLFITHWVGQENALYMPQPAPVTADGLVYLDGADRMGLGNSALRMVGWATRFFDLDNDGWLDLFVVNGSTIPRDDDRARLEPMRCQLYWHATTPRRWFHELGAVAGGFFDEEHVGRGGATFDYDLDGDEDLLVTVLGDRPRLLRNDGADNHASVRLRLRQPAGNRFALGARVEVDVGDRTRLEVLDTQGSYLSQHTTGEVSFGIGGAHALDRVRVTWPDGVVEEEGPFFGGSLVTWERGARPRIAALPGRAAGRSDVPPPADLQRRFFDLRDAATDRRLAGDLPAALDDYRAALAVWPGHTDVLYYLGNCLLELEREAEALRAFETLVAFEPRSNAGWMQVGRVRSPGGDPALDDLEEAEAAFARCHDLNGEESEPLLQLGKVALARGDLPRARTHLADAARLNPRSVAARYLGGRAAWLAGDADDAERLLAEAWDLARATGAGDSASNEGDTRTGVAMTTSAVDARLEPWRSLAERAPRPPREEYAD